MARTANILLVDDDVHVRQALGEVLADENYEVSLAASGEEAVRHLHAKGAQGIDAVLLDLMLGLENGWNVFRRLTSLDPSLRVIVFSSGRDQRAPAAAYQCVALMQKPLNLALLCQTLRHVTAKREPLVQRPVDDQSLEEQDGSAS